MANGTKLTTGDQLEAVSVNVKRYILSELLTLTNAITEELENFSGATVLDTVPATVDGGLWFELDNGEPVIKFHYDSNNYQLSSTIIQALDPQLKVTRRGSGSYWSDVSQSDYPTYNELVTSYNKYQLSFLGDGTISCDTQRLDYTYDAENKVLTFSDKGYGGDTVIISLSASPPYAAASVTLVLSWDGPT